MDIPCSFGFFKAYTCIYSLLFKHYFFQKFTIGQCVNAAPVAYLQDFNVTCVTDVTACSDLLTVDLNVQVNPGNGGQS